LLATHAVDEISFSRRQLFNVSSLHDTGHLTGPAPPAASAELQSLSKSAERLLDSVTRR
jgi:hypothetical protein